MNAKEADIVTELQKIKFQRADQKQVQDNCRKICERYGWIGRVGWVAR